MGHIFLISDKAINMHEILMIINGVGY